MSEANTGSSNSETVTRIMDDILLNTRMNPQTSSTFFSTLAGRVSHENTDWDVDVIVEHWSWLKRTGVIVSLGPESSNRIYPPTGTGKLEEFYVTPRGRKLLATGEASPHNPVRFDAKIRSQISSPDDIVMTYVDEAVGAWAAGLNRAAAVMIGCACERLILLLAQSLTAAEIDPWSERIGSLLAKAAKSPVSISKVFQKVREALLDLAGQKELPKGIADALDRKLTPIFEYARGLRNKSGHPTAVEVSHEDAEAGLLLFPGFYIFIGSVIKTLGEKGVEDSQSGRRVERVTV